MLDTKQTGFYKIYATGWLCIDLADLLHDLIGIGGENFPPISNEINLARLPVKETFGTVGYTSTKN